MNWFQNKNAVTSPDQLINWDGKDGLLETFVKRIINHRENLQIIGISKSGKTSIMNCISNRINNLDEDNKILCVTINFTGWNDRINETNGFNLISASILDAINNVDELKPEEQFILNNNIKINAANDISGYINKISSYKSHSSSDLFTSLVLTIAEKGYSLVLLIDNYETMYFDTFRGKKGSNGPLRKLITEVQFPAETFIRCCVSGPKEWLDYSNKTKSVDFDFLESADYLPVFNLEESKLFIKYVRDAEELKMGRINYSKIYELSGGSPHLIKRICDSIVINKKIEEDILKEKNYPHFVSRWNELSYEQKLVIKGKAPNDYRIKQQLKKLNLIEYVNSDESEFIQKGALWNSFVKEQDFKYEPKRDYSEDDTYRQEREVSSTARSVIKTLHDIQYNLTLKFHDPVFDTSISSSYFYYTADLINLCDSREVLKAFLRSVYELFFSATKRFEITVTKAKGVNRLFTLKKQLRNSFQKLKEEDEENKELEDSIEDLKEKISNQQNTNFIYLKSKIDKYQKHRAKKIIWKHPDRWKFMTSKKSVFDNLSEWLKKEEVLIKKRKFPINLASVPNKFNRFPEPENIPQVVRIVDILRHDILEAHDPLDENFITSMNSAEAWSIYTDTFNPPQNDDFYKIQIGILKDLQKFLAELHKWALEQSPAE